MADPALTEPITSFLKGTLVGKFKVNEAGPIGLFFLLYLFASLYCVIPRSR